MANALLFNNVKVHLKQLKNNLSTIENLENTEI